MLRKPTGREVFRFVLLALLVCIVVGYALVCLFLMIIGVVAEDLRLFGYGFGGASAPIILPTIIGDIKEWFF